MTVQLQNDSYQSAWHSTCHNRPMREEFEPGLVSVIVPTYNRAHLITEAADTVYAQTYRPIELLLVDDGSTDSTEGVVAEWIERHRSDPQFCVRYLRQENYGAPAARNRGLIESRGEYIQFLDSDDGIAPEKIAVQVAVMQGNSEVDVAYCRCEYREIDETGAVVNRAMRGKASRDLAADFLRHTLFPIHAPLWRKDICRLAFPWAEDLRSSQDWEFGARCALRVREWAFDTSPLVWANRYRTGAIHTQADAVQCDSGTRARLKIIEAMHRSGRHFSPRQLTSLGLSTINQGVNCYPDHPQNGKLLIREGRRLLATPWARASVAAFLLSRFVLGWRSLKALRAALMAIRQPPGAARCR